MKKRAKQHLTLLSLLCLSLFLFPACTGAEAGSDAYLCAGHRVEASWEIDGRSYAGILTVKEGLAAKDGEILYTAPRALAGIRVVREGGAVSISLGDAILRMGAEEAAAALDFFTPGSGVTVSEENGKRLLHRGKDRLTVLAEEAP